MTCGDHGGKKANGDPCKQQVKLGFTRCPLHGAANPISKIKAEQMLAIARIPAIEALYKILDQFDQNTCTTCGFPVGTAEEKRMIIQACRTILDRTGMGPHSTFTLTPQTDGPLNLEILTPEERGELLGHLAQIKAIKDTIRKRQVLGPTTIQ
jgi:hypothetical protein